MSSAARTTVGPGSIAVFMASPASPVCPGSTPSVAGTAAPAKLAAAPAGSRTRPGSGP
ncbi:hypothetical protein OG900_16150 [Streptomyces sp. NBC_00433]